MYIEIRIKNQSKNKKSLDFEQSDKMILLDITDEKCDIRESIDSPLYYNKIDIPFNNAEKIYNEIMKLIRGKNV